MWHQFVTLNYTPKPFFEQKAFSEVVLDGNISYLRKHTRFPTYDATEKQLSHVKTSRGKDPHIVCYDYFVYYDNNLVKASQFNKKVLPLMLEREQSIHYFTKKEKLQIHIRGIR